MFLACFILRIRQILQDHKGWYITFQTADCARRAARVLSMGTRTLAHHSVNVSVHPPPTAPSVSAKTSWTESEAIEEAEKIIMKDLRTMLEKDIRRGPTR